jgi:hypothetical protein
MNRTLRAVQRRNQMNPALVDFRFWHYSDGLFTAVDVRLWGRSGQGDSALEMTRLTQLGHGQPLNDLCLNSNPAPSSVLAWAGTMPCPEPRGRQ